MINRAARNHPSRVLDVQHLVKEDILKDEPWNAATVQSAADDDCPVNMVVMPKHATGLSRTPGEKRLFELVGEIPFVQTFKGLDEIVNLSARRGCEFISAPPPRRV